MTPATAAAGSRESWKPLAFFRSPLGVALIVLALTLAGSAIKDRITTESHDAAVEVRIDAMDKRIDNQQAAAAVAVSRPLFEQAQADTNKRLDDIRQDVRDLKRSIDRFAR